MRIDKHRVNSSAGRLGDLVEPLSVDPLTWPTRDSFGLPQLTIYQEMHLYLITLQKYQTTDNPSTTTGVAFFAISIKPLFIPSAM